MLSVACPSCSGTLGLTTWKAGQSLRCPRCKTLFQLGASPSPTPPATTPEPTPEPNAAAPRASRVLVLAAVLLGLLAFIGGTVGLAFLVAGNEPKPQEPTTASTEFTKQPPTPQPNPGPNPTPPQPNPNPAQPTPLPPQPTPPGTPRLPGDLQAKVNAAVDRGVAFLRSQEQGGGFIGSSGDHGNGSAFLVGLTLLECGVPATDPTVQRVATVARTYGRQGGQYRTYDLSTALLFLDRLGDPTDKGLIQSMGLSLLGGQLSSGGWMYDCALQLPPDAQTAFLAALRKSRPDSAAELILRDGYGRLIAPSGHVLPEDKLDAKTIKGIEAGLAKLTAVQEDLKAYPELQRRPFLRVTEAPEPGAPAPPLLTPRRVALPRHFPQLPHGDNSNTQFAALGLWVASRHDVPCERALALLAARFRTTQGQSGAWAYGGGFQESASMTCAGLLALAIGHGLRVEATQPRREDPQIAAALKLLADQIKTNGDGHAKNLYLLWSLERVGVLFNLDKIGDIDWYEWGARHLVAAQSGGGWHPNGQTYIGTTALHDTCFALLFLKKANLAADLSNKMEQVLDFKALRR